VPTGDVRVKNGQVSDQFSDARNSISAEMTQKFSIDVFFRQKMPKVSLHTYGGLIEKLMNFGALEKLPK
jgi:hypothetical protein